MKINRNASNPILTPAFFYILFALRNGEKHGYDLMKTIKEESDHKLSMGPGTLYGSLKKMVTDGLIQEYSKVPTTGESEAEFVSGNEERRKYYVLTAKGNQQLTAEIGRFYSIIGKFHQDSRYLSKPIPMEQYQ